MRYERFIAKRYLRSKQQTLFINIIMLVSVIGITVGVAALIVILSVFNGFSKVVSDVLIGFDPHVRILPAQGRSMTLSDSTKELLDTHKQVKGWAPYVESKALIVARSANRIAVVKGVVDTLIAGVSGVRDAVVLGEFDLQPFNGRPGIVLGMALADKLGVVVGSEVTVVSPIGIDAMVMQYGQPDMRKFTVVGIYDSRNKEYDTHYAFIDFDIAGRLFQMRRGMSGIELRLASIADADRARASLAGQLGNDVSVLTWYDLHKDLYSVMQIERWSAFIILSLIIGVASFNILGSLTMGVIEKRRDIGVLKSLGATNRSIMRVFMFEGVLVGTIGTVLGIIIGLVVCYLQIEYKLFPLDPNVYIIPAIPIDVRWSDFFAVGGASMLLSMLSALYPAYRAARLLPVEAIRWE